MPNVRQIHHGEIKKLREFIATVYSELLRTRVFVIAAALAFYSLLSLTPLLMVLSGLLSYLPIPQSYKFLSGSQADSWGACCLYTSPYLCRLPGSGL
jgi:uncharacterized BrkB/YihY/UPF0761 family membrane protein